MTRMSEADAWAFLRAGSRTATFASIRPDGRPHAVPTWYAVDGDEIVFTTGETTVKARESSCAPAGRRRCPGSRAAVLLRVGRG